MSIDILSHGDISMETANPKNQFSFSVAEAPVEIIHLTNRVGMEVTPSDTKLCTLCKENNHKYKCKYCDIRYCSVKCSNRHKSETNDHEEEKEKLASAPPPKVASPPPETTSTARAGTLGAAHAKSPFESLDTSTELQELFKRYPNLWSLLEEVDIATLRPEGSNSYKWNQDQGWEKGRKALNNAKRVYGKDGEGVREYCELISRLLGDDEDDEEAAAEVLRREALEESTRVIRQLLESDKRR